MLEVSEINSIDQFFKLRDDWDAVLGRSRDNTVFLTWECMVNSVKKIDKGKRLRTLLIKEGSKTIAIAPLRQTRYNLSNWLGYEVIEPLAYWDLDYTGLILAESEQECLSLFLDYLYKQKDWDFIYLYNIPETSTFPALLPKVAGKFPKFETRKGADCPYLTIPESIDGLMDGLSAKFRKNLRRSMRNLERDHGKVELKKYTEVGSLEETLQLFQNLHQKRWTLKGKPGAFADQDARDMNLNWARLMAEKDWLALYFLMVNNTPIATQCCFEYNQKIHYWLGGFDPTYVSYSVGNLMILKVLERCVEKKVREYDFMRGAEPYKFTWNAESRRNIDTKFVSDKITSRFYDLGINAIKKTKFAKVTSRFLNS